MHRKIFNKIEDINHFSAYKIYIGKWNFAGTILSEFAFSNFHKLDLYAKSNIMHNGLEGDVFQKNLEYEHYFS